MTIFLRDADQRDSIQDGISIRVDCLATTVVLAHVLGRFCARAHRNMCQPKNDPTGNFLRKWI